MGEYHKLSKPQKQKIAELRKKRGTGGGGGGSTNKVSAVSFDTSSIRSEIAADMTLLGEAIVAGINSKQNSDSDEDKSHASAGNVGDFIAAAKRRRQNGVGK